MKVALVLILALAVLHGNFPLSKPKPVPAPRPFGLLIRGFTQVANTFKTFKNLAVPLTRVAARNSFKFGRKILVRTKNFSQRVGSGIKNNFVRGITAIGNGLRKGAQNVAQLASKTKDALRNIFKRKQGSDGNMARDLSLPFDSDGAPLQGGPGNKKKKIIGKVVGKTVEVVAKVGEVSATVASTAIQVQSLQEITKLGRTTSYQNPVESTSSQKPGTELEECSVVPNFYTRPEDRRCDKTIEILSTDSDDSDADQESKVCLLKVSQSLILTYKDEPLRKKKGFCRKEVKNTADKRPSYVQAFQLMPIDQVTKSDLQVHREATLTCQNINIPLSSLRQGARRPGAALPPPIPEKTVNGQIRLAYDGITWHTNIITNSCTMDSFFTHVLIKSKQKPTFAERNFLIPQNGAEGIIKEIARLYNNLPTTLSSKDIATAHDNWKKIWVKTHSYDLGRLVDQNKKVDFVGHESDSIMSRLEMSILRALTITCDCDHTDTSKIIPKFNAYVVLTIEQVRTISRENQHVSDYGKPLGLVLDDPSYKWCRKCTQVKINFIFVPSTTWMLYWLLPPQKATGIYAAHSPGSKPYVFDVNTAPKKFIAHELYYEHHAEFELAYISMSTTIKRGGVYHHLSFQYFNQKFYYYDDMHSGHLVLAKDPNRIIADNQLTIESIIYMRA